MTKLNRLLRTGKWGTTIRASIRSIFNSEREKGKLVNDLLEEHFKKEGKL